MREDTKLAAIRRAMRDGDWDRALILAARFRRLGKHAADIKRAADAMKRPETYRQLGFDLAHVRAAGIAALKARYSNSWEAVRDDKPRRQK